MALRQLHRDPIPDVEQLHSLVVVVVGAVKTGKTEFIRAVSEVDVFCTEQWAAAFVDGKSHLVDSFDLEMDFGLVVVDRNWVLYLLGTPSYRRFDRSLRDILTVGSPLGFVVLIDSVDTSTWWATRRMLRTLNRRTNIPYVVAANKQDSADAWSVADLRIAFHVPVHVPLLPCVATDKNAVKNVLQGLFFKVLADSD